jgi:multisubunit Na+/H+ antiporter MnhF subunit
MPGFDVVNNLNVAQQLFGLLFAVTYGAMLMASRRYGLFNTYKAVLKMRGPNSKRAVLGFVFLNILPVLHFALLMFWFGRIYLRSDLAMVLGLLIIGLQPVAVFGYHRMLLGSLYCCPNTFFDDGLTELGKIEE